MRKFLIATHGALAKGIKSSLDIIIGPMENLFLIQAYMDDSKPIEEEINTVLGNLSEGDELVIFTDLLGGSITNQLLNHALKEHVHIVSGCSLPLVIDVLLSDEESPAEEVIEAAINNAKGQIVYVNKLVTSKSGETAND